MKHQKRFFNEILIRYNRYRDKLNRLIAEGKNLRKQDILRRRLKKMHLTLLTLQQAIRMATAGVALAGASLALMPQTANAQAFNAAVTNPFSLTNIGQFSAPAFADLDADGDLDMISGSKSGSFYYFQNTGSVSGPAFAAKATNPFGLNSTNTPFSTPAFADLDHDGDLDMMVGEKFGNFYYFQNTGTSSSPAFAAPVQNPFGIQYYDQSATTAFADLDNDGDLDMVSGGLNGNLTYYQNTGTVSSPAFAAPVKNPFGLTDIGNHSAPAFADLDGDGDKDMMVGTYGGYYPGGFFYFKNTGTSLSPAFASPELNYFGLTDIGTSSTPAFADLDNDGNLDMMSGAFSGSFYYFKNIPTETWTGASSGDWNTAGNWSENAVPNAFTNVNINAAGQSPIVNQGTATPALCNNLTINGGGMLSIEPGKALTVNGTLTNSEGVIGLIINSDAANGSGSLLHHTQNVPAYLSTTITGSATLTNYKYHLVSIPL
ncbi:MAG: VCBS repeat-containing protein, partial [Bacteroidota bacterium]